MKWLRPKAMAVLRGMPGSTFPEMELLAMASPKQFIAKPRAMIKRIRTSKLFVV